MALLKGGGGGHDVCGWRCIWKTEFLYYSENESLISDPDG